MNLQNNKTKYKNAIYTFGYYLIYRLLKPWLLIPSIYKLSSFYKKVEDAIKVLHTFSTNVIKNRQKALKTTDVNEKRLSLIDILLKAKENSLIDDEGIREEVDTFMFEVISYYSFFV